MAIDYYGIAKSANQLRDTMNIKKGITDIFRLLEDNGYHCFRYPLGEDSILGAAACFGEDKVILSNSSMILAREIFTVAHELGHHHLHFRQGGEVIVDSVDYEGDEGVDSDFREIEANYFAACFLMPKYVLKKFIEEDLMKTEGETFTGIDVAMIQSTFNVSFESAVNRLHTAGIISEENRKSLEEEKEKNTVRAFLQGIKGNLELLEKSEKKYMPQSFLRMAFSNYERKLVPAESLKKIIKAFDIPLEIGEEGDAELFGVPEGFK